MNEDQIACINRAINEAVAEGIRLNVNGKIDRISEKLDLHNEKHELDMQEIMPVIEAFKTSKNAGVAALWIGGFITTTGGAFLILKSLFFK